MAQAPVSDAAFLQGGHRVSRRRSLGQPSVPATLAEPSSDAFAPAASPPPAPMAAAPAPQAAAPPSAKQRKSLAAAASAGQPAQSTLDRQGSAPASAVPVSLPQTASDAGKPKPASPRGEVAVEPFETVAQTVRMFEAQAGAQPLKLQKKRPATDKPTPVATPQEHPGEVFDCVSAISVSEATLSPVDSLVHHDAVEELTRPSPTDDNGNNGPPSPDAREQQQQQPLYGSMLLLRDDSALELEEVLPLAGTAAAAVFPLAQQVSSFAPTMLQDVSRISHVEGHARTQVSDSDSDDGDDKEEEGEDVKTRGIGHPKPQVDGVQEAQAIPLRQQQQQQRCEATDESNANEESLLETVRLPSMILLLLLDADAAVAGSPPSLHDPSLIDDAWYDRRRHELPTGSTFAPYTPLTSAAAATGALPSPFRSPGKALRPPAAATPEKIILCPAVASPGGGAGRSAAKLPAVIDADEFFDEGGVPLDALEASMASLEDGPAAAVGGHAATDGSRGRDGRCGSATSLTGTDDFSGGVDPAAVAIDSATPVLDTQQQQQQQQHQRVPAVFPTIGGLPKVLAAMHQAGAAPAAAAGPFDGIHQPAPLRSNGGICGGGGVWSTSEQRGGGRGGGVGFGGVSAFLQPPPDSVRQVGLRFHGASRVIRPQGGAACFDDDDEDDDENYGGGAAASSETPRQAHRSAMRPAATAAAPAAGSPPPASALVKVKVAAPNGARELAVPPVVLATPKMASLASTASVMDVSEMDWKATLRSAPAGTLVANKAKPADGGYGRRTTAASKQPAASPLWISRRVHTYYEAAGVPLLPSALLPQPPPPPPQAAVPSSRPPAMHERREVSPEGTRFAVSAASLTPGASAANALPVIIARDEETPQPRPADAVVPAAAVSDGSPQSAAPPARRRMLLSPIADGPDADAAPPAAAAALLAPAGKLPASMPSSPSSSIGRSASGAPAEGPGAATATAPLLLSQTAAPTETEQAADEQPLAADRKARRLRNVTQALSAIDARYTAKAAELAAQQQPQPRASPVNPSAHLYTAAPSTAAVTGREEQPTGRRAVDQLASGLESMLKELRRIAEPPAAKPRGVVEPHSFRIV